MGVAGGDEAGPGPLGALANLAAALAGAHDQDAVLVALRDRLAAVLGVADATVAVIARGAALDAGGATATAARSGEVTLGDHAASDGTIGAVALPLSDAKGQVVSVVTLSSPEARHLDGSTRAAARVAFELGCNAMRHLSIVVRAARMAALAGHLSGAVTTTDVARVLRDHGAAPVGATLASVRLVSAETGTLEGLVVATSLDPAMVERYVAVELDAPFPISHAVRTDESVWLPDLDEYAARFPEAAVDARAAGFAASAAVPIHDGAGAVIGVLAVAWTDPVRLDELVRAAVLTIADLVAQSLERARLTDAN
ncbi:MAG: GAF domain-containing protein, partial [Acidimicrobiia bacterium]|nr:GAF domain-containing protein [Acidimicrobiia bacterium]